MRNPMRKLWTSILLITAVSVASAGNQGTVPKSSAGQYKSHAERDSVALGAALLTADQVRKAFSDDVNRCCIVVEVAFYPAKDKPLALALDDLTMQGDSGTLGRPLSARSVAATIQDDKDHPRSGQVATTASATIGYESGTYIDPATGQRVKAHDVYTETGVGAAATNTPPPPNPNSGPSRAAVETQLGEQALPEGTFSAPVSGYVYFPKSLRKKKNAPLELDYESKDQTLVLTLP